MDEVHVLHVAVGLIDGPIIKTENRPITCVTNQYERFFARSFANQW